MGKRGPAPKPTSLKLIQGTYRKDRAAPNEPQPEPGVPTCPAHLKGEARREWKRIAPVLQSMGVLTKADRPSLAGYCSAWEDYVESDKILRKEGRFVQSPNGFPMQHPAVNAKAKALTLMKQYLALFGLSPSDRTRVSVPEKPKKESNPFAALG